MKKTVRECLLDLAEEDYRQFQSKLLPGTNKILGVRLPRLRQMAREMCKGDWRAYLHSDDIQFFEEVMLQGMIIGGARANLEEILNYCAAFIPKIDNWSVCDSFCSGLKITHQYRAEMWDFIQPYLQSSQEFELRFGLVMLLNYYLQDEYFDQVLMLIDSVKHDGYYAKMAAAWAISACFVKFPQKTLAYLQANNLDKFTYNKALQKITESYSVDPETKALIRSMKI